jgi:hypothetical protein
MKRMLLLACAVSLSGAATAQAANIPITMNWYDMIGQTTIFSAEVTMPSEGSIVEVLITDDGAGTGSSGVFSGFDLDFLVFDMDGDFSTVDDQISPLTGGQTAVIPGVQRKGINSIYQPTLMHPGALFGLTGLGAVDDGTATLGTLDAQYVPGYYLSVDSSNGWISLGDNGQIRVSFPVVALGQGQTITLFIGEAGPRSEFGGGSVEIVPSQAAQLVYVTQHPPGQGFAVPQGVEISLSIRDPGTLLPPSGAALWNWDLDGDGSFDDGVGQDLPVTFEQLTQHFGLSQSTHTLAVKGSDGHTEQFDLILPEPATLSVLAVGGVVGLLRHRRRRPR